MSDAPKRIGWKSFAAGVVLGVLVGLFLPANHYTVTEQPGYGILKVNTRTGKTWRWLNQTGEWRELR